jgi:hypothetical protein
MMDILNPHLPARAQERTPAQNPDVEEENPEASWWGLTQAEARRNKILAAAGGIGVLTLLVAGIVSAATKKEETPPVKRKAIEVDGTCQQWNVLDASALRDELRTLIRRYQTKGPINPFDVATEYSEKIAPHCVTFPSNTRTAQEAKLYVVIFNTVLDVMNQEKLTDLPQMAMWTNMVKAWAVAQGVPATDF